MIFLQLNPFNKSVAITEILILLLVAALLGWFIARLATKGRIQALRESIDSKKLEIADYQSQKKDYSSHLPVAEKISKPIYPAAKVSPNAGETAGKDDLKVIEGIGPKIEELINKEGVFTFEQLSNTSPIRISHILKSAGPRFQMHDPTTWPEQAQLAKEGKWEALEILKGKLISGRH